MAPTYPDFTRCHKPLDVPPYAKDLNCCPPYQGETPVPFTVPKDLPMRTRVSAHRVDEKYVAKYARAVQLMKDLPPDDPRNFTQQANVHCAYCQGAYYMGNTDKPFMVHNGWFFLPWHRWYLYFHERMLAKLVGDDTFALPFWNHDYEPGMTIPPMYLDKSLSLFHDKRNPDHGPSSIADLSFYMPDGYSKSHFLSSSEEDQVSYNYRLMYKHMVSLAKTTRTFHGAPRRSTGPDSSTCTCAAGTVEIVPHDTVHSWTGNLITEQCPCPTKTCYGEDMGVFYAAARDPIFYALHANVDRMWTIWKKLPGREDYTDPDLLDTLFYFYDENKLLVSVRAGDAFDPAELRYSYEASPTPWLQKPVYNDIRPALPPLAGGAVQKCNSQYNILFSQPIKVPVPRQGGRSNFFGLMAREELLVIKGIRVQRNLAVKFDIFVNLDDRLLATSYVDSVPREYAGTFLDLPRGARDDAEGGCGQSSLCVGISEVLRDLNVKQNEESIVVTLLPKVKVEEAIKISAIKLEYSERNLFGMRWMKSLLRSVLISPSKWGLCPPLGVFPYH
nr:polyphenol oxidase [Cephalotaxus hainanensis]